MLISVLMLNRFIVQPTRLPELNSLRGEHGHASYLMFNKPLISQAQARCHRIGQSKAVKVYRLITRNSYEREMFDKASLKLGLDKAVLQDINRKGSVNGVSTCPPHIGYSIQFNFIDLYGSINNKHYVKAKNSAG